ncbi:hypothetical protein DdX_19251 [Ditylenchus destructor]|uniref:Uncharacterized protein n=1 Tax=Ditylenchus destructor TaxID=166010 RepID=A0AAD4QUB1_9BILA|nr:hypothetical protein DdX_19251 [Ditylenchus destructor]
MRPKERYVANQHEAVIEIFNEKLSLEEYNELIVRNGYSKQVPLEGQIVGKESIEDGRDIYVFSANVYQNPNHCHDIPTTVIYADVELKDETYPLFQHFIHLLMDPFIYIRALSLYLQKDVLSLFAAAMNPDRGRLHCKQLNVQFHDDTQKFVVWIKDHVRCDEFQVHLHRCSNYDEELLDFFMTGAHCTSAIYIIQYDLSKAIVDLAQKFKALKNCDEYQMVESIRGNVKGRELVEALKDNCAEFIADEESLDIHSIIRFINNDIQKKLTLYVRNFSFGSPYSINPSLPSVSVRIRF